MTDTLSPQDGMQPVTHPIQTPGGSKAPPEPDPGSKTGRSKAPRQAPIPEVDEILRQLIQLNGAVLLGMISARDAGILQRNLKTVLDVQLKRSIPGESGPNQEGLVELCRRDPRAIATIEPFLSQGQLQSLMEQIAGDGNDEPA